MSGAEVPPFLSVSAEGAPQPQSMRLGPLDRFDRWALGLMALVFLLQLLAADGR